MTVTILVLIILGFLLWPLYYFYWSYRYNNQDEFEKKEISFEEMSAQILKEVEFLETAYVNLIEDSED